MGQSDQELERKEVIRNVLTFVDEIRMTLGRIPARICLGSWQVPVARCH